MIFKIFNSAHTPLTTRTYYLPKKKGKGLTTASLDVNKLAPDWGKD